MKNKKTKMTKDVVPNSFTISLAIVDAIPVIFFSATFIILGIMFNSILFLMGAVIVLISGVIKVLWKIIVVLKRKNIWWMFIQMRILMPIGMVIMILAVVSNFTVIKELSLLSNLLTMPSVLFFGLGTLCMILMTVFAFTLDSSDCKSNWIEQITNSIAQISFFMGVLLIL